jgi:hypothetical protein
LQKKELKCLKALSRVQNRTGAGGAAGEGGRPALDPPGAGIGATKGFV